MQTRVIAAGGGGQQDSSALDQQFAHWIGKDACLLYWPLALPQEHPLRASCFNWIRSVFGPLGVSSIEMWNELHTHELAELHTFDALYIGGGNTYLLMHQIRASGFDAALLRFIAGGKAVYGGSAGAAILGHDIETVAHMDNNIVQLEDLRGLNMFHDHAVWCHYTAADDARIATYIEAHARPVLAVSERAGVALEDGRIIARGYEPTIHFNEQGRTVVKVGHAVDVARS